MPGSAGAAGPAAGRRGAGGPLPVLVPKLTAGGGDTEVPEDAFVERAKLGMSRPEGNRVTYNPQNALVSPAVARHLVT